MPDSSIVMIALGDKAQAQARLGMRGLCDYTRLPILSIIRNDTGADDRTASRAIKTRLLDLVNEENVLYLDADTRVQGDISAGFQALEAGWDMALSFSDHQNRDAFWHVDLVERDQTVAGLGYIPLQWQCGVMFVRRNERTRAFFDAWHQEWAAHKGEDQAAFVRALHKVPLKLWVLGRPWNGGAVIQHRFGACR